MVQGGGFDVNMQEKPILKPPLKTNQSNGLQNKRGTLAMARTNQPDSARAQFFVNLVDNIFWIVLPRNAGYAVFGKVTKGMDDRRSDCQSTDPKLWNASKCPGEPCKNHQCDD